MTKVYKSGSLGASSSADIMAMIRGTGKSQLIAVIEKIERARIERERLSVMLGQPPRATVGLAEWAKSQLARCGTKAQFEHERQQAEALKEYRHLQMEGKCPRMIPHSPNTRLPLILAPNALRQAIRQ